MIENFWKKMFEEFVDDNYFDLMSEEGKDSNNENSNREVVNLSKDDYEVKECNKKLN